jgi:hypothetical protein
METQSMSASLLSPQPQPQNSASETRSKSILGPVMFELSNLRVAGRGTLPADPVNSPYIIAENEVFDVSVDIEFNKTPLTELLMCLGTRVGINFAFEGFGKAADEVDLAQSIKTTKGNYKYTITYTGVPKAAGMDPGLYEIAAVAEVGPVENACSTKVWGHGYIQEVLLEVYPAGEE